MPKHCILFLIYSQSSQTLLTDCFTLTGSSEENAKSFSTLQAADTSQA